jgi:AbiJ N-terminal domain 4
VDESFSVRYGYEARKSMQVESMDAPLRNSLWNCVDSHLRSMKREGQLGRELPPTGTGQKIWHDFFKSPVDEMPRNSLSDFMKRIRAWFMSASWNKVYDFLQFLAPLLSRTDKFLADCNYVLERESAGYRFINLRIVPIVSLQEIREVEAALVQAPMPARTHLDAALILLSDRDNPNYRKSVDESISAVEAAVRSLTGNRNALLPDGLKALGEQVHPAQVQGFIKLYGYTSDEGGIRHALTEDSREVDAADARYMLISCSAFVNYLRSKAGRELA